MKRLGVILVLLLFLGTILQPVYGSSGNIGCSAGNVRTFDRSSQASVGYNYLIDYYMYLRSPSSSGSSTKMETKAYIYNILVLDYSFWGGYGYGQKTNNYSIVLITNPIYANTVNFTATAEAHPTSCETKGYYETSFDNTTTTPLQELNKGSEITITNPKEYYYMPEPVSGQILYFNMMLRNNWHNETTSHEETILDYGLGYITYVYPSNQYKVYDSGGNLLLTISNRQLYIEGKILWNGTKWYYYYIEFNGYQITLQSYLNNNYVVKVTPDSFSKWSMNLPYSTLDLQELPSYILNNGYTSLTIVNRYLDDFNTEFRENKTIEWYYDSSSDTAFFKLQIDNTTMVNLTKYEHYRVITVTSNEQQTVYNVTVMFSLDAGNNGFYPSKHNPDEIIFSLDQTKTQLLNYTIDTWDTSIEQAKFTVLIPQLNVGTNTIYMWYDTGQNYTSYQVITGGLYYVDDFEDGNINEYAGDTASFTVDSTSKIDGVYSVFQGGTGNFMYNTLYTIGDGTVQVDFIPEVSTGTSFGIGLGCRLQDSTHGYMARVGGSGSLQIIKDYGSGAQVSLASVSASVTKNARYKLEFECKGNSLTARLYDVNGNLLAEVTASDNTYTSGYVGIGGGYSNGGWYDNLVISSGYRQANVNIDNIGNEQIGNPVGWYWARPKQIVFEFDGSVRIDYLVIDSVQDNALVTFNSTTNTSLVYMPQNYNNYPNGFTSLTVYWHVVNASSYGLAIPDPNTGSSSGISLSTGSSTSLDYKLFFYLLPLIAGLVSFVLWGIAGLGVAALVNMYLAIAGVGSYWISYVLVLGLIFFLLYKIMRGGIG